MLLAELQLDRNLIKQPNQTNSTDDPTYVSSNPTMNPQNNTANNSATQTPDAQGAKNIITGTVITACLIQTSATPSRIELAGNDLSFYDNTFEQNGKVVGDTSRLIFTHDLNSNQGFVMEKRASVYNTYDNVLSWYGEVPAAGAHNYMFIGRNAFLNDEERNVSHIGLAINTISNDLTDPDHVALNGTFSIEYSVDGVLASVNRIPLFVGNTHYVTPSLGGYTAIISGGDGGLSGMGYLHPGGNGIDVLIYCLSNAAVTIGAHMIPDTNAAYNIGSPSFKFATIYGSVVACPLPTVENALDILEKIPAPTMDVGDRGHYGDNRLYFDDITFPKEVLHTTQEGTEEIEHSNMLGFLLQIVIELNAKVKVLEANQLNK